MRFSVLPVGQGTGTLVEVLDATGKPEEISLIDLGSKGWEKDRTGVKSEEFVVERLKAMDEPTLETIFLSHGDEDHINLVVPVLREFFKPSERKARKQTLEVQNVFYAGDPANYVKDGVDILGEIAKWRVPRRGGAIRSLGMRSPGSSPPLHVSASRVSYLAIVWNTIRETGYAGAEDPTRRGSAGYLRNLVSLVLAVGFGGAAPRWIVATGDATGLTLLDAYKALAANPGLTPPPILSLTLPHHGSVSTTYDFLGMRMNDRKQEEFVAQILEALVTRLSPQSLSVSAGEVGPYKLPRAKTIGDFGVGLPRSTFTDPVAGANGMHFYTAYFSYGEMEVASDTRKGRKRGRDSEPAWPEKSDWFTVRSDKAVFTTDYFMHFAGATANVPEAFPPTAKVTADGMAIDPPATWVTGWAWEIDQVGNARGPAMILRQDADAAAYLELLERVHGPFPSDPFLFIPSAPAGARLEPEPPPEPARVTTAPVAPPAPVALGGRSRVIP